MNVPWCSQSTANWKVCGSISGRMTWRVDADAKMVEK